MSFEVFAYSCRAAAFTAEGEAVLAEYNAFCVYSVIIILTRARPCRLLVKELPLFGHKLFNEMDINYKYLPFLNRYEQKWGRLEDLYVNCCP